VSITFFGMPTLWCFSHDTCFWAGQLHSVKPSAAGFIIFGVVPALDTTLLQGPLFWPSPLLQALPYTLQFDIIWTITLYICNLPQSQKGKIMHWNVPTNVSHIYDIYPSSSGIKHEKVNSVKWIYYLNATTWANHCDPPIKMQAFSFIGPLKSHSI
jgi:hypothetical protein